MSMTKFEKAPVDVVMPEVKLTIADLGFMTGLMGGGGSVTCSGTASTRDRLVFLGLIEMAEIPPCKKAVAEHEKKEAEKRAEVKAAIKAGDWGKAFGVGREWSYQRDRVPTAKKDFILTASGREFMAKGRAKSITATKGGCVK